MAAMKKDVDCGSGIKRVVDLALCLLLWYALTQLG